MVDQENQHAVHADLRQQVPPVVVAIDDDTLFLLATVKALASANMVCHTATTGEDGLRLIRECRPDIVLLDILLNGEDGFTICREIRRTWSTEELPVIMVTGLEDLESIKTAYESGANDFLAKPLHWTHLPYRIWQVLRANRGLTEQKKAEQALRDSEEKFSKIFHLSPDAIDLTHLETGVQVEANQSYLRMFGYTHELLIGHSTLPGDIGIWVSKENRDRLIAGLKDHGEELDFETLLRRKDGSIFICLISSALLEIGGEQYNLSICRDITERKASEATILRMTQELEQRVKDRTAQLEAANKEMEAFSYSVSHDLRSPLRSIDGFSQVLLEDYSNQVDEAGKHYLQRIRASTQRMGILIDDLLKLSKTSHTELMVSDCDLSKLCSEISKDITLADPERRVEITIQPGMIVQADKHLMRVALGNTIRNAWKFTSKSQDPRIEVGEIISPGGERAFFVRDNDAGFDMAHAEKLFNAFERLHAVTDFEGTGIGLAIVQRIIHRHGGRIWAEAEPGAGATFFFTIPDTGE
jgi:PAS domain S-box-containing protein